MSVKRKWLTRISVSLITLSMLLSIAACGDTDPGTTNTGKTVITYSSWEAKYVEYEMAALFEKSHPNIDIQIIESGGEWEGTEWQQKQAASDTMPDIINVEKVEYTIKNDWVIDLKPYVDKDEEIAIPQNILDGCTFNDKLIMVPYGVFFYGYMLNRDFLTSNNIPVPEYDWTFEEFSSIMKASSKPGISIGTNDITTLVSHFPAQANPELALGGYNSTTRHYEMTNEWVQGGDLVKDLYDSGVSAWEQIDFLGLPWELEDGSTEKTELEAARLAKTQELVGEEDTWNAWTKGKMATWADHSWSTMSWVNWAKSSDTYTEFDWDVYPVPTVKEGTIPRPFYTRDSRAITTSCENPDVAWEYFKFNTFAEAGVDARIDIYGNYDKDKAHVEYPDWEDGELPATGNVIDVCIPPTTNQNILDKYFAYINAPKGIIYLADHMDIAYTGGDKVTPGFNDGYGNATTEFQQKVLFGTSTTADIAPDLEKLYNDITDAAYAAIETD